MEKQIRQGRQVYVICPMVEESEGMDGENVLDYTRKLAGDFSIGYQGGISYMER